MGDSIAPWYTPLLMFTVLDFVLFVCICAVRPDRKLEIHFFRLVEMLDFIL